jgi:ribosomal protein S18 acetylase RimI-like enzyme
VLVARLEDSLVGYVRMRPATELRASRHVLEIVGLAVDPAAGGRGVGRALVNATLDAARMNGFRRVTLRVLATNTAARALYEACGFTVEGILQGEFNLNNRDVDDVLMAYPVATGRPGKVP